MAKMYYDDDADMSLLDGKRIAIIGYGIQGGAQSLCLRDSGCDVVVSELEGTPNYDRAVAEGYPDPHPGSRAGDGVQEPDRAEPGGG